MLPEAQPEPDSDVQRTNYTQAGPLDQPIADTHNIAGDADIDSNDAAEIVLEPNDQSNDSPQPDCDRSENSTGLWAAKNAVQPVPVAASDQRLAG